MTTDSETIAVQQEYDRLAGNYDRRWRSYVDETLRAVVNAVVFQGHERVLDLACGTGELERVLLSRWPHLEIVGADLSHGMLQKAANKPGNERVTWMQTEAGHLPFPDQCFDNVICANSFHYFREPRRTLQEVHRVLRPGGTFVLVDWCDDFLSCKLCGLWLRLTDPAFCRTYTVQAARGLIQEAGFEIVRHNRFRVDWIWGMMCLVCRAKNSVHHAELIPPKTQQFPHTKSVGDP